MQYLKDYQQLGKRTLHIPVTMSVHLVKSQFEYVSTFTLKHQNLHAEGDAWFWWVFEGVKYCSVVRCNSGGKSLPLAASRLFCTTCCSQREHAVCTYHIWHVLSLERSDWSVGKCCGLVFWATDSFLFPRPPNTPLIPLLGLLLYPTQTDTCFLSFLIPLPLLGAIFPSIQLCKHWNW